MEFIPFYIYKFVQQPEQTIPGYFVVSNSPINEDIDPKPPQPSQEIFVTASGSFSNQNQLKEIAEYLHKHNQKEIVIAVHGYSSKFSSVQDWYREIYSYINNNMVIKEGTVFIGFRWPSENPVGDESGSWLKKLKYALKSLPILPTLLLLFLPITASLISLLIFLAIPSYFVVMTTFVTCFSISFLSIIATLIILRMTAYFRDSYRAINFAIPDLVELLRQIDGMYASVLQENSTKDSGNKIKLSFIAHSMGCFVATKSLDFLMDKFDPIHIDGMTIPGRFSIGNAFVPGRLVLAAPDIPAEITLPQDRRSSLKRCLRSYEESYVFMNEGDLALRLASTSANYFSFPVSKREHGYRLGNVSIADAANQYKASCSKKYGAINSSKNLPDDVSSYLEIRTPLNIIKPRNPALHQGENSMNLATFFDCTDYKDTLSYKGETSHRVTGVVSHALQKRSLNIFDYILLTISYSFCGKDTHGGYFKGQFCQTTIYGLAFLGFEEFIQLLTPQEGDRNMQLKQFLKACEEKQIKLVLSPVNLENWLVSK